LHHHWFSSALTSDSRLNAERIPAASIGYADREIFCGDFVFYGHRLIMACQSAFFHAACKENFKVTRRNAGLWTCTNIL
jgi:hypothetical protein